MRLKRTFLLVATMMIISNVFAAPQVGDMAPDFTLPGSDGNNHTLSDLRGKHVVIAFFPKAYTGG